LAKATVAAVIMGAVVYFLREPTYNSMGIQNFNVFVLSGLGALVYGALLWIFGALPKEFMRGGSGEL
jgi:hypothetical protein